MTAAVTERVRRRATALARPATSLSWRRAGADWPIWAVTVGMPLMYLLGFQGFVWSIPMVAFGVAILSRRGITFPPSATWLLLFCLWSLLSITQVHGSDYLVAGYRWTLFAGTLACLVWVANRTESELPASRVVAWLAALWLVTIGFGYLAILLPRLNHASPLMMLTGPLGRARFVSDLSSWRLAEFQQSQGVSLPRPAAPWAASNGWGAAIGVLTPFFVRSWIVEAQGRRRTFGLIAVPVGIIPILVSGNRGLWISIGVAFVYWTVRKVLEGDLRPLGALLAMALVVLVALVATPAGTLVQERLDTAGRSNDARSSVYDLAWHGSLDQPWIGHGTPKVLKDQALPPIGSHGLLWYLMYCNGFVGLALFAGWILHETARSARIRGPGGWWTHLSLLIGVVSVPFYGMLPQIVLLGAVAGLAHRETGRRISAAHPAVAHARRQHPVHRTPPGSPPVEVARDLSLTSTTT